jgi:hypothetical protein
MNKAQKILTFVFLALFTLSFVWFPFLYHVYPQADGSNWMPNFDEARERFYIHAEWTWLAVVYFALFFVFKSRDRK